MYAQPRTEPLPSASPTRSLMHTPGEPFFDVQSHCKRAL